MTSDATRVVFVDYDGTLLTAEHTISTTTRSALSRAVGFGLDIVATSSRPLEGIHFLGGPHLDIVVALNGALVRRGRSSATWEATPIPQSDVELCLSLAGTLNVCFNLYTASQWWTSNPGDTRVIEERSRVGTHATKLARPLPNRVQKILILGDPADLDTYEHRLATPETSTPLDWFRSEPSYLEIGRADISKATGVAVVRGWLAPARTYAIGDGHSDIAMFNAVDVSIAVANATLAVREAADVIVAANEHDGVAEALDRIISGRL
jgi:Cof subfamily protein (haloacid dehalogenase superfamily)